nr:MAG TPA: DNA-packaging protein small subunit [Caudoviricetes sp.]
MARTGRPRKEIDQKQFESLCGLQCTLEEICGWFGVCSDTLESWCKRTYKMNFSEVFKQKRSAGKISLRRSQWRLAEKNANMAIWLGKQYLGQKDQVETTIAEGTVQDDGLSASLRELARSLKSDGDQ